MDPGLHELIRAGAQQEEVAVIMRLDRDTVPAGARIVTQFESIATARVPRGAIATIRAEEGVLSLKAPRLYRPDWVAQGAAEADQSEVRPSDERRPEGLAETGCGVVVALVDW